MKPKDGVFYATKTALGCEPGFDRNRRIVYQWPDDEPVLVMNERMRRWTEEDDRRLSVILAALNRVWGDDVTSALPSKMEPTED